MMKIRRWTMSGFMKKGSTDSLWTELPMMDRAAFTAAYDVEKRETEVGTE